MLDLARLRREHPAIDTAVLAPAGTWGAVTAHTTAVASVVIGVAAGPALALLAR